MDGTVPQNTEGDEYITQAITPVSAINALMIRSDLLVSNNMAGGNNVSAALFQDSVASALSATGFTSGGVSYVNKLSLRHRMRAGTASATTFKVRAGGSAVGTTTVNSGHGASGGSYLEVSEIMV
jgi:hypothetical protein